MKPSSMRNRLGNPDITPTHSDLMF